MLNAHHPRQSLVWLLIADIFEIDGTRGDGEGERENWRKFSTKNWINLAENLRRGETATTEKKREREKESHPKGDRAEKEALVLKRKDKRLGERREREERKGRKVKDNERREMKKNKKGEKLKRK